MPNWDKFSDDESQEEKVSEKETKEELENGNPQTIDYKVAHKEAADALTIKAEELIKTNVKLASLNPKSILDMDKKMQNKVIKEVYWYNTLEELKALLGDKFYEKAEENWENEDITLTLQKEVKLLKYQSEQGELNRALETYALKNPDILKATPDAIIKIKTELEYISDKLSHAERIERASKVLFWTYTSDVKAAYLAMQDISTTGWANENKKLEAKQSHADLDLIFDARISSNKKKEEYLRKMRG